MMDFKLSTEDKERIVEGIRKKYAEASVTPQSLFNYPTGREGLKGLGYDPKIVEIIPKPVIDSFCGVGNPFSLGPIHEGETVLDIGCGGGFDVIFAAIMVGPKGKVVGIDVTPEMLGRSKKNLQETSIENVTLRQTNAEELPFPDNNFDVIVSNGVFNLIPEKAKAFSEVFRVLKLDGRLMVADQILIGELSKEQKLSAESWAQ
jgi:SAM-dependent methyltransferase